MELLKDYNYTIQYHLNRANIVVDALSRELNSYLGGTKTLFRELHGSVDEEVKFDLT